MEAIAGTEDPVLRNLRITSGYHRMARAFHARVGPGGNWFAFAVWASKQAGETIRGEDPWRWVERELALAPEVVEAVRGVAVALGGLGVRWEVGDLARRIPDLLDVEGARGRTADALARGNAQVFREVAGAGARFLQTLDPGEGPGGWDAFQAGFRPGPSPEGQELLLRAFQGYRELAGDPRLPLREEWILRANLEIGVHEQIRLQPEVQEAMDSLLPPREAFRDRVLSRVLPGPWLRIRLGVWRTLRRPPPLDRAVEGLRLALGRAFRRALTRRVMAMELAGVVTLRLGEGIPGPVPATLLHPRDPELRALLSRYRVLSHGEGGGGSGAPGAGDWGDVEERLRFIARLFRRYQELPELLLPPFAPEQERAIAQGRRPGGRL